MKKILMTAVCVMALAAPAMAQSSGTSTKSDAKMDNSKAHSGKMAPADASKGTSTDAKSGVPGNPTAGGDGSQSNPKSSAPGAAKAGGG
jgi:hypothetical protein